MTTVPCSQGGNNIAATLNPIYKGRIIDQMVTTTQQDDIRVVLTVQVQSKLKNAKDPSAGTEACDPKECEVWITFVATNDTRLRMAVRDLERLGFADHDISRLHPEHANPFRVVGKDVHVRCKELNGTEYWNLSWPRETVSLDKLQRAAVPLTSKIAALLNKNGEDKPGAKSRSEVHP